MSFRLLMQPSVAIVLAVRAGLQDARMGRPAYFWAILNNPAHRREMLTEGWKAIAKVFVMVIAIDTVYQLRVFGWFYPFEALAAAFLLACVPYGLSRGPVNKVARAGRRA